MVETDVTLTDEEIQEHAERIANAVLEDLEYCYVYEDEDLEDHTEGDWQAVHSRIQSLVATTKDNYEKAYMYDDLCD